MWMLTTVGGALLEFLLFAALGTGILFLCLKKDHGNAIYIYLTLMLAYGCYVFFCHYIRCIHEWTIIGSADGGGYYIPCTLELSSLASWHKIWEAVGDVQRYRPGGAIFFYFVPIQYLADWLQMDLHLALQISLMPFAAMICVVEYRILLLFDVDDKRAVRWSIGFGILSALFWLSSFIVRDLPICLAYAIVTYTIFSETPRLKKLLIGAAMTFLAANIRLASGMGLFPLVLFAVFADSKNRTIKTWQTICGIVIMLIVMASYNVIDEFGKVSQAYLSIELEAQGGNSILASFNVLPPGVSHVVKTLYAQFHPIPAWRNMFAPDGFLEYAHNITKFPDLWVVFFRISAVMVLIYGCCTATIRKKVFENKLLLYSCIYALLLLCTQASTIEERRKFALYPILFIPVVLSWIHISPNSKKGILLISFSMFLILQLITLLKNLTVV